MDLIFLWVCFMSIVEIYDVHVIVQQAPKTFLSKLACCVTELLNKLPNPSQRLVTIHQYYDPEPYFYLHC